MKKLLAIVGSLMAAAILASAEEAMVTFSAVPEGSTITYMVKGKPVTETVVVGKQYPASAVVTLGAKGEAVAQVVGNATPVRIRGDKGATFTLTGSSALAGVVVTVPAGGSNLQVAKGDGKFVTVPAGASSGVPNMAGGTGGGAGGSGSGGSGSGGTGGGAGGNLNQTLRLQAPPPPAPPAPLKPTGGTDAAPKDY